MAQPLKNPKYQGFLTGLGVLLAAIPVVFTTINYFITDSGITTLEVRVSLVSLAVAFAYTLILYHFKTDELVEASRDRVAIKEGYDAALKAKEKKWEERIQKVNETNVSLNVQLEALNTERNYLILRNGGFTKSINYISRESRKRITEYYNSFRNMEYQHHVTLDRNYAIWLNHILNETRDVLSQMLGETPDVCYKALLVKTQSNERIRIDKIDPQTIEVLIVTKDDLLAKDEDRSRLILNPYPISKDSILESMILSGEKSSVSESLRGMGKEYINKYMKNWPHYFDYISYFACAHYGEGLHTGENEIPLGVICVSNKNGGLRDDNIQNFIEFVANVCYLVNGAKLEYVLNYIKSNKKNGTRKIKIDN